MIANHNKPKSLALPTTGTGSGSGGSAESGAMFESAVILDIADKSFDVLITRFGMEKRLFLEDLTRAGAGANGAPALAISAVIESELFTATGAEIGGTATDANTSQSLTLAPASTAAATATATASGGKSGGVTRTSSLKVIRVQWTGSDRVVSYRILDVIDTELTARMSHPPIDIAVRAAPTAFLRTNPSAAAK